MGTFWLWWIILYYLVIFAVIFGGKRLADRYPENSSQRGRAEMALGCAFMAMPTAPLIVGAVWVVSNTWTDPVLGWVEAYFALLFTLALFYGAMGKYPWLRELVAKILSPLSRK
jgi:hypothetical protein